MKPFQRLDGPPGSSLIFMDGNGSPLEDLCRVSRLSRSKVELVEGKEATPLLKMRTPKCSPCILNYLPAAFDFDDQKSKCQMWWVNRFTIRSCLLWDHSHNPQICCGFDWWLLWHFCHSLRSHVRCRMGLVVRRSSEATVKALRPSPALVSCYLSS